MKVTFDLTSGPQSLQVTLGVQSIVLKWREPEAAQDGVHVALAHFWPGEQRGSVSIYILCVDAASHFDFAPSYFDYAPSYFDLDSLRPSSLTTPLLVWTTPFRINRSSAPSGSRQDSTCNVMEASPGKWDTEITVDLRQVAQLRLQHYSREWKSLRPIQVRLYRVYDPVHFTEPQNMPEIGSTEHDLFEKHSGLQLLSQAHVPIDAIIENRDTGTGIVGGPGTSLANTIIQHQKKGDMKIRLKGVLRPEYKCTLHTSIR